MQPWLAEKFKEILGLCRHQKNLQFIALAIMIFPSFLLFSFPSLFPSFLPLLLYVSAVSSGYAWRAERFPVREWGDMGVIWAPPRVDWGTCDESPVSQELYFLIEKRKRKENLQMDRKPKVPWHWALVLPACLCEPSPFRPCFLLGARVKLSRRSSTSLSSESDS